MLSGDFNNDTNLDLAVANSEDDNVSVLLGNGDGTFQHQITYSTGYSPASIIEGDLNDDNKLDLAIANAQSNSISILLGNGDGTFQNQSRYSTGLDS